MVATVGRQTAKRNIASATTLEYHAANCVIVQIAVTMRRVKGTRAPINDIELYDILLLSIQIHKVNE